MGERRSVIGAARSRTCVVIEGKSSASALFRRSRSKRRYRSLRQMICQSTLRTRVHRRRAVRRRRAKYVSMSTSPSLDSPLAFSIFFPFGLDLAFLCEGSFAVGYFAFMLDVPFGPGASSAGRVFGWDLCFVLVEYLTFLLEKLADFLLTLCCAVCRHGVSCACATNVYFPTRGHGDYLPSCRSRYLVFIRRLERAF